MRSVLLHLTKTAGEAELLQLRVQAARTVLLEVVVAGLVKETTLVARLPEVQRG